MMVWLFAEAARRRKNSGRFVQDGSSIEACESRSLLSANVAMGPLQAESSRANPDAKAPADFSSFWLFEGTSSHFLAMQQTGDSVVGDEMQGAISVGTLTGKVRGTKLKAEVIGFGYKSTFKVKLTDETHFTGIVKTVLDGKKQKPETVNATHG